MPIYEYRCMTCEHEFEAMQKMRDDVLKDCPKCGKPDLKKLMSAAGFQLKGTGWYETDFKNNGNKPKPEKPKESKPSGGGSCCGGGVCGSSH